MNYQIVKHGTTIGGDSCTSNLCKHDHTEETIYRQHFEMFGYSEMIFDDIHQAVKAILEHEKVNQEETKLELMIDRFFPKPLPYLNLMRKDDQGYYSIGLIYPTKFEGFYV